MEERLAKIEEKRARDSRLQLAIANDDVDELHGLIVEERQLLDRLSKDPFPNTPLHIAAAAGKTDVAMEMAILKPSFARELNPEGYSPMHLALQHEHYHTARALIILDPRLIQVRGRRGITPLHYVAGKEGGNELELLAEFLSACKSSIKYLTSRCETAVHIAVKNHNLEAFKVLLGWLKRVYLTEILDWKDQDGNTVLHIAASEEQPEIIKMLIECINVKAKNFQDRTALEILQANPGGDQDVAKRLGRQRLRSRRFAPTLSLSQLYTTELTIFEKYARLFGSRDESARNIILLVSSLIATATYQTALAPPGGYWQDSTAVTANSTGMAVGKPHQAANLILNGRKLYMFTVLNTAAFSTSVGTIWATAVTLLPDTAMVYLTITILYVAYFFTLIIELPKSNAAAGFFLCGFHELLLFAVLVLPLHVWVKHNRVLKRIDATRRPADNFLGSRDRN